MEGMYLMKIKEIIDNAVSTAIHQMIDVEIKASNIHDHHILDYQDFVEKNGLAYKLNYGPKAFGERRLYCIEIYLRSPVSEQTIYIRR